MKALRTALLVGSSLLALGYSLAPVGASGGSRLHDIKANLQRVAEMLQNTRQKLGDTKRRERRVADQLNEVQEKLDVAKTELGVAKQKLTSAEAAVQASAVRLQAAKLRLGKQRNRFGQRVRASYLQGPVSYADVLLGANDINDFLDRQYYIDRIMSRDAEILTGLRQAQRQVADEHDMLRGREKELEGVHAEVAAREDTLSERRQEQAAVLQRVRSQRHLQEQELDDLEADSARIEQQLRAEIMRRAAARKSNPKLPPLPPYSGGFGRPAAGPITSRFGVRFHPISKRTRMHNGVDIGAGFGAPIRAAAGGEVLSAGWNGGYGKCIILLHGGDVTTLYGHCSSLAVRAGQQVRRGQVIGYVGSTGHSTGPHLHFEVRRNGRPVNPL